MAKIKIQVTAYTGEYVEHGKYTLLLVEVQTCTTSLEINLAVSQKIENSFYPRAQL